MHPPMILLAVPAPKPTIGTICNPKSKNFLIVLSSHYVIPAFAARLLNCPKSNIKFEKIIGLPPINLNREQLLVPLNQNETDAAVTIQCLQNCQKNEKCQSFVLFYDTSDCYWFENDQTFIRNESGMEVDNAAAWFVKVCLQEERGCNKSWVFETVRGATLIGNDTKALPRNMSRSECQQNCLDETDFDCRSVKFRVSSAQNETVGLCTLSNSDRHLMPTSYRVSTYDDYYLENQCTKIRDNPPTGTFLLEHQDNEYCTYEEYGDVAFKHKDLRLLNMTKDQCQHQCEVYQAFNCRGFSLDSGKKCILHSEDTKLRGPRILVSKQGATYYEKARCLNITVSCTESYMTIRYQPETNFHGKLYMHGNSENKECFVVGQGKFTMVTLKLQLLTNECGIVKADSPTSRNLPNKGSTLITTISNETVAPVVEMRVVDLRSQDETTDTQIGQELQLIIELKEKTNTYDLWASHLIAMTEKGEESIFLLDDRGCPTNLNIFPALSKTISNGTRRLIATFQAFKFASSPVVRFSVLIQFCSNECSPIKCDNNGESYGRRKREVRTHLVETINGSKMIRSFNQLKRSFEANSSVINQMPLEYVMIVRDASFQPDRLIVGNNDGKILVAGYNFVTDEVCMDYSLVIGLIVTWVLVQLIFIIACICLVRRYKKHYQEEFSRASMEDLNKNFGLGFSNLENRRVRWADNGDNIM
ncbi:hypothetical protein HUJ04_001723 [Dendroctonus ponderosae]|nr:hypothetical protein HUJ04_001723 [Dendroctonus ponderosae]